MKKIVEVETAFCDAPGCEAKAWGCCLKCRRDLCNPHYGGADIAIRYVCSQFNEPLFRSVCSDCGQDLVAAVKEMIDGPKKVA